MTNVASRAGCSYFGVRIPRHVRRDMADLAARGYTGVLHTFSENDFAYYRETTAEIAAASHADWTYMQTRPWRVGRTCGAGACVNSPAYRDFCNGWADWVPECGLDSVFWDAPAWVVPEHVGVDDPARWTCRCEHCAERFGGPVPAELTPEVTRFRQESVVGFLRELVGHVVSRRGGANTICLLPATEG